MILNVGDRIARGAFADIFAPAPGEWVYKIFRRLDDPHLANVAPHVFRAEVCAYELAQRDRDLMRHMPAFSGSVEVTAVLARDGSNISRNYWLNLCYSTQRLRPDPEERKVGSFFNSAEWHLMEPFEQRFEAAGIRHIGDASVFYWRTEKPIFIDFAMTDAAADYAEIPDGT